MRGNKISMSHSSFRSLNKNGDTEQNQENKNCNMIHLFIVHKSQRFPQIFQQDITVRADTWKSMKGFEKAIVIYVLIVT